MMWFLLSLTSAASQSLTDLFSKKALVSAPVPLVAWVRVAFPLPILAAIAVADGWTQPHGAFWLAVGCAIPLEILAALLYQRALQLSPLGLTAPYLAFTPAFLVFTGRWILGEAPTPAALMGIGLIVFGGYLVQLAPGMGPLDPLRALIRERGSLLMLAVSFLYSITSALGKIAVLNSGPTTFAFLYYLLITVLLAPKAVPGVARLGRREMAFLLPISLFGSAMILTHFLAIRVAPASYMVAVKRTSLLWSILLGRFFLNEDPLRLRLLGGSVMLAGAFALAVSG